MIKVTGLNTWKRKTEAAKRRIRTSATKYVQNQVRKVYVDALRVTPQWSGSTVWNWTVATSAGEAGYSARFKVSNWRSITPKQAGHPTAINAALKNEEEMIQRIRWNSNVYLVNKDPTMALIEEGKVKLRPENLIPGGMGVKAYLKAKYRFLT